LIAYLDTSALFKLYVEEPGSDLTWQAVGGVALATCRVTWVGASAALARRERELPASALAWSAARQALAQDWPSLRVVDVTQALVLKAGELAEAFALRACDAVHLAAAQTVHLRAGEPLRFVCFDHCLNRAARLLGLALADGVDT